MSRIVGLGRLFAPDDRDNNYPLSAALPAEATTRKTKYYNEGKWKGNQGSLPACVGYAWAHFLKNGPNTQKALKDPEPVRYYRIAQTMDEWPGEQYAGTSVRGGAKAVQSLGYIDGYLWGQNIDDIIKCLLEVSPVVAGTIWTRGMSYPDAKTFVIKPTGVIDGGHAYLLNGINMTRGVVRMEQSWGDDWGDTGTAWIELEDLEKLLFAWDGEACKPSEK